MPAQERGKGRGAAGLDHKTKDVPQHSLRADDIVVFDQDDPLDVLLGDRKHELAHSTRRQRVGGDAARGRINGSARLERFGEGRRSDRFDADDAIRLGHKTEWIGGDGRPVRGVGRKLFLVGDEARTLLELGEVKFEYGGEGMPAEGERPLEDRA